MATEVHLKSQFRTMHTQVIGTTNAGKTASVILPWIVRDLELGRGMIIVDGKSDRSFLDQLYAHAKAVDRHFDFELFSLACPNASSTFNPFAQGTAEQITERVFSSFSFTDEYYRAIQYAALRTIVALLMDQKKVPMPGVIRTLLKNRAALESWAGKIHDKNLESEVATLLKEDSKEFEKRYSGLVTALGHFSFGAVAPLFNTERPHIILSNVIRQRKVCYFQLPTMQFPFLGEATGKLVLQCLQSAISEMQVSGKENRSLFSVYLDDFNDYIYPGFISVLNKSRSAGIGVVFAHQSIGDLKKVGDEFTQSFLTNTNVKIIMRSPDPESAEYFAKAIGTKTGEKTTERRSSNFIGLRRNTGEQSVRDVEEYIIHPNEFKSKLGTGEGIVVIPHSRGRLVKRVKFAMAPKLRPEPLPEYSHLSIPFERGAFAPGTDPTATTKPARGNGNEEKA
jgi:type IV secretory pathway TraG/TraD family ATPase VirD4